MVQLHWIKGMKRLLVCLFLATPTWGSLSVTSSELKHTAFGSGISMTAANHAAGDLLVFTLATQAGTGLTASIMSNTAGDTWYMAGTFITGLNLANTMYIFYAYNSNGNASDVVTATYTQGGYETSSIYDIHDSNGAFASDPVDATSRATGTSTNINSGNVAITGASDIILAVMEHDAQGLVAGTGYTLINDGGYEASEYHIVSAAESATATGGGANDWVINAASFKGVSGTIPTIAGFSRGLIVQGAKMAVQGNLSIR